MARIVLACWGSYGDLFPYLAIADALTTAGHTPVIASCPVYAELVTAQGFQFFPMRPDVRPDDMTLLRRLMDPMRGAEVVVREITAPAIGDAYADLMAASRGADAIVSHPITFAAPLVAERLGLPWLASTLAPLGYFSMTDFPVLPNAPPGLRMRKLRPWAGRLLMGIARRITSRWTEPVRKFRAELGLAPAGDPLYEGQFSPYGNLALFSRVVGPPQADWPARTVVTGFPFSNRAIPMPGELQAFLDAGASPIVFTLGSSAVSAAGSFYDESAAAAGAMGRRAVLLVGRHPENIPAKLPAGVIAIDSAPHDQLFARAAAIVHQGGVGTTGQALRSGRPQLVVPFAHDQPDNAFRVSALGAGRVLYPKRYRASRAAADLDAILGEPEYARRAGEIGVEVRAEDGAGAAAAAIAGLLAH